MNVVEKITQKLDNAKSVGEKTYTRRCPAHKDNKDSLSIHLTEDGRVLLHCFSGCATTDILNAVGMSWKDLLPRFSKDDEEVLGYEH